MLAEDYSKNSASNVNRHAASRARQPGYARRPAEAHKRRGGVIQDITRSPRQSSANSPAAYQSGSTGKSRPTDSQKPQSSGTCMDFKRSGPTARRRTTASGAHKQQRSQVVMRRLVTKPLPAKKRRHTKKRPLALVVLPAMAAVVFVVGLAVSINGWQTNQKVAEEANKAVAAVNTSEPSKDGTTGDGAAPSTTPPSSYAINNYTVSPGMPRYFKMPQYDIKARVLPMGVDRMGAIQTPGNIHDVGWYNASSKPGEDGAVLLDAHVSSWTANGVFYHLKDLKPGDTVQLQRGDDRQYTYKVVKTKVYDKDKVDMTAATLPVTKGKPGLNMITCTGEVIPDTNEFDKRLIVFTEQV